MLCVVGMSSLDFIVNRMKIFKQNRTKENLKNTSHSNQPQQPRTTQTTSTISTASTISTISITSSIPSTHQPINPNIPINLNNPNSNDNN